jgi:hypothetical protein
MYGKDEDLFRCRVCEATFCGSEKCMSHTCEPADLIAGTQSSRRLNSFEIRQINTIFHLMRLPMMRKLAADIPCLIVTDTTDHCGSLVNRWATIWRKSLDELLKGQTSEMKANVAKQFTGLNRLSILAADHCRSELCCANGRPHRPFVPGFF